MNRDEVILRDQDRNQDERPGDHGWRDASLDSKLDQLTRGTTRESLRSLLGRDLAESTWRDACRRASVDDSAGLDLGRLARVADELAREPGAIGLVGSSLGIRIKTYEMLARADRLRQFLGAAS